MTTTIQQTSKWHKFTKLMVVMACVVGAAKIGSGDASGAWWIICAVASNLVNNALIWWNHK